MQPGNSYAIVVVKKDGHLRNGFFIQSLMDVRQPIKITDNVVDALRFDNLKDAYYAWKQAENLAPQEVEIYIAKLHVTIEVERVALGEIRSAILTSAKSKLTPEEYEAIQYHTFPVSHHKGYKDA